MYRIIIADDEPIMHKALMALVDWKALDCEIVGAYYDGQAVVDHLQAEKPDIIISDIRMPRQSGIEIAQHISENALPIKVILLTAYADFSYAQQAIRYGVTEYVTKTGAITGIVEAVNRCIENITRENAAIEPPSERITGFLKAIMDRSLHDLEKIDEKAALYKVAFSNATLLRMDVCGKRDSTVEQAFTEGLAELLQAVFSEATLHFIPVGKTSCFLLLCNVSGNIQARCNQVTTAYDNLVGHRLYIGISEPLCALSELPFALGQAEKALAQRFFDADTMVYCYRIQVDDSQKTSVLSTLSEQLEAAVSVGNETQAQALVTRFLDCQKDMHSVKNVKTEALLVMKRLENTVRLYGEQEAIANMERTDDIETFSFFFEYAAYLQRFVSSCCRIVAASLKQGGSLIANTKRYIDDNYCRQLSLAEIASAVGANPSYLSRLYKEKSGITITDAVNRKKIARAQALLDAGGMKVYEIAAQIGIDDTTYFSHLFRKYTGVSPRTYQENRRAAQQKEANS